MKLIRLRTRAFVFMLPFALLLPISNLNAQDFGKAKITLQAKSYRLIELLKLLDAQTEYSIGYGNDLKDEVLGFSLPKETTLGAVLEILSDKKSLRFRNIGKTIYVRPKVESRNTIEKGTIRGKILNNVNEPIPFVSVILKNTRYGTSSDENGNFSFSAPKGTYTLVTKAIGYQDTEKSITVQPNKMVSVSLMVIEQSEQLDEVRVYAKSKKVELEQSAKAVTVIETAKAKLQAADLGEVLTQVEGVNIQRTGGLGSQAQFSLNGLSDDQIRFFLNGIPLDAMGYVNGLANVPVNLVDRVEIYKGVVPIRFGADALGGAVNLISNEAFEGTGGSASYQLGSFGTHRLALHVNHRPLDKAYFVNVSGFYDRARNNYKIDVDIADARGVLTPQRVERFHDDYLSRGASMELGIRNKRWADVLMVRGFYTKIDQDIQHNFIMTIPYGEVTTGATSSGGLLKWDKSWNKKLSITNTLGYAETKTTILDTASVVYRWDGQLARDLDGEIIRNSPGERGAPSDILFRDQLFYHRLYAKYAIGQNHDVRFSSAPTYEMRGGENALLDADEVDRLTLDNAFFSFINGLEYEYGSSSDKLTLIGFVKNYIQHLNTERIDFNQELSESDRRTNNYGAGASVRYTLNNSWQMKASYERATRLPNLFEVFGDGFFVSENVDLRPERSHNANLSANFRGNLGNKAYLNVELNAFLRYVEDFIQLLGTNDFFIHRNVENVTSSGLELSSQWSSPGKRLQIEANGTYISYINTAKTGPFTAFEGDRLPNRPYLFANASGSYAFKNLFSDGDGLRLFLNGRFVNKFFRSWESIGRQDTKQVIPSQFTQNSGLTYSTLFKNQRLSITAEVQNI
ncbi:MAG: TonB-dependent receptor, partial [Bacteroidota bacterium]